MGFEVRAVIGLCVVVYAVGWLVWLWAMDRVERVAVAKGKEASKPEEVVDAMRVFVWLQVMQRHAWAWPVWCMVLVIEEVRTWSFW